MWAVLSVAVLLTSVAADVPSIKQPEAQSQLDDDLRCHVCELTGNLQTQRLLVL